MTRAWSWQQRCLLMCLSNCGTSERACVRVRLGNFRTIYESTHHTTPFAQKIDAYVGESRHHGCSRLRAGQQHCRSRVGAQMNHCGVGTDVVTVVIVVTVVVVVDVVCPYQNA